MPVVYWTQRSEFLKEPEMSQRRIIATGKILPVAQEMLHEFASIDVASNTDEDSLLSMMEGTIGLIVRGGVPISRRIIEGAPDLRVIGRTGVGYDNVDISAATEHGIPVVFTPGAGAKAVAEGTLSMILALTKRLGELDRMTRAGQWSARDSTPIGDLDGATLGIIGLGRIGTEVARLAQAFGMKVIGCDPAISQGAGETIGVKLSSFEEVLSEADVITLHAPLNDQNRGMLDARRLSLMKRGAIFVNLARGGLVNTLDILNEALESGRLSGVGLDVYPVEPPDVSHPIFRRPDVICTPHCMGLSTKAAFATLVMMSEGIVEVLRGGTPKNVANPEVFSRR
jgi:D-3-phosphoglycerate dehydrogenase / 2-oxoglutarate reductase